MSSGSVRSRLLTATVALALAPSAVAQAAPVVALDVTPRVVSTHAPDPFGGSSPLMARSAEPARAPSGKVPQVAVGATPAGFVPMETVGIAPTAFADDQIITVTTPEYAYDGQVYAQLSVASNGYVVVGAANTTKDLVCCGPAIGSTARPNGVIAPFGTDLVPGATGMRIGYVAPAGAPPGNRPVWIVVEWAAPGAVDGTVRKAQLWLVSSDPEVPGDHIDPADEGTYLTYDHTTMTTAPTQPWVIGAENADGTAADTWPTMPTENFTVTFVDPNHAPVGTADSGTTTVGQPLIVDAPGLLANDSDPDGNAIAASLAAQAQHGAAAVSGDGAYTYTPDPGYEGPDSFTYRLSDGELTSDPVSVAISVGPRPNTAPAAAGDAYGTDEDQALTVPAPGLLGNDSDADGDPLTATAPMGPDHGSVTLGADGSFTYTPVVGYSGPDSFSYRADDGVELSDRVTVTLTVDPRANTRPAAADDAYETPRGQALTVAAPGVLANDTDAEGDPLTVTVTDAPAHGVLTIAADGSFGYAPDAGYSGKDRFGYAATDGRDASLPASVTVTVTAPSEPGPTPTPTPSPTPTPTEIGDRTAPVLTVFKLPSRVSKRRLVRRGITPVALCDEACSVVGRVKVLRPGAEQETTVLQTRATRHTTARQRIRLKVRRKLMTRVAGKRFTLIVYATDRNGNRTITTRSIGLA